MDAKRFDTLVESFSTPDTRRALLRLVAALPLAGALAPLVGREVSLADGSGAIVGGRNRRNRGKPNRHDKRDHGDDKCNKKCGPCKRCKDGKCKKKRDGTVCQGDGVCTNGQCAKGGPTPPPPTPSRPTPTCTALSQSCPPTDLGTPCCPDVDPKVVCAGGNNFDNMICQDCNQAPTAEGAFCQDPPGNQCCGGSPTCFVGIRVEDNEPACFLNGNCQSSVGQPPCTHDFAAGGCPSGEVCCTGDQGYTVCVQDAGTCGCSGTPATYCGLPCP